MHFHFLIEDQSGKIMLEHLVPKIIDSEVNTYEIKAYEGIGRLPKSMPNAKSLKHKALLNDLPRVTCSHFLYQSHLESCMITT
jgi:hypothetical protein